MCQHTVNGCEIHFASPKRPWNDLIPLQIQKQIVVSTMVSFRCDDHSPASTSKSWYHFVVKSNGFRNHPQDPGPHCPRLPKARAAWAPSTAAAARHRSPAASEEHSDFRDWSFLRYIYIYIHIIFLSPPLAPFYQLFLGEGSPTKIDRTEKRRNGTLIVTSQIWRTEFRVFGEHLHCWVTYSSVVFCFY